MLESLKDFIDKLFSLPFSFLDLAKEKLVNANNITARGLNINSYLSVFNDLPSEWRMVVTSLLISTALLLSILIFKAFMRMFFVIKEGVKWW